MSLKLRDQINSTKTAEIGNKLKLLESTNDFGYRFLQVNGQRIFGPPPFDDNLKLPKGCEIFVGHLPRDMYEDELFPLFSTIGPVYKMRLMLDFSGRTRGYAFVCYFNANHAARAVKEMNGLEVRPNRRIGVYTSVDNCRLFVGGIPTDKTKEEIVAALNKHIEGIAEVIMCQDHHDKTKNRGYVFVEFVDHKMAALARRATRPCNLSIWGSPLLIDWADPIPQVDPSIMATVTKLYLSNLPLHMTSKGLYRELNRILSPTVILKCHKINDFGFLHFMDRKSAELALTTLEQGIQIGGQKISATWARPCEYNKRNRMLEGPQTLCTSLPSKMRNIVFEKTGRKIASTNASSNSTSSDESSSMQSSVCSSQSDKYREDFLYNNLFELGRPITKGFARGVNNNDLDDAKGELLTVPSCSHYQNPYLFGTRYPLQQTPNIASHYNDTVNKAENVQLTRDDMVQPFPSFVFNECTNQHHLESLPPLCFHRLPSLPSCGNDYFNFNKTSNN